jgi:transcription termination/antitermination protein NusG
MMILTLRTTTGRENVVIDSLSNKVKKESISIMSIFHPSELKGYIFIEGDTNNIETLIKGVPHVRGLINKDVPIIQLERFLIVEKQEIKIDLGDIIEVVGGPMKGDKAKVIRINESKKEITVESLEAAIPIPVTIPVSSVTMYEKKK